MEDFNKVIEKLDSIETRIDEMDEKLDSVVALFNEVGSTDDILSGDVAERIAEMMGG